MFFVSVLQVLVKFSSAFLKKNTNNSSITLIKKFNEIFGVNKLVMNVSSRLPIIIDSS